MSLLDLCKVVHSLAVADEKEPHRALGESVVRRRNEESVGKFLYQRIYLAHALSDELGPLPPTPPTSHHSCSQLHGFTLFIVLCD